MRPDGTRRVGASKVIKHISRSWRATLGLSQRLIVYLVAQTFLVIVGVLIIILANGKVGLAIGTSLLACGAAGGALFGYVLLSERWSGRIASLLDAGLREVWPVRSVQMRDEYDRRLEAACEHIDLIGFGQRSFREDHIDDFAAWTGRGVAMRLLLLDPTFPSSDFAYADQRDREEGSGTIAEDVRRFLSEVKARDLHQNELLSIRLFRCLPVLNLFRIDDDLFWGPYLVQKAQQELPNAPRGPRRPPLQGAPGPLRRHLESARAVGRGRLGRGWRCLKRRSRRSGACTSLSSTWGERPLVPMAAAGSRYAAP